MDRAYSPINSLLEQAACIARKSKEAAGTLEPTKGYKRGQIKELIEFANTNNLWISLTNLNVDHFLPYKGHPAKADFIRFTQWPIVLLEKDLQTELSK